MATKTKHKILRIISIFISLFVAGIFIGAGIIIFWMSTLKLPDTGSLGDRKIIQSTKIYDRSGEIVLWDVHEDVQRTVVSKEDISRHIKNATVAIEDSAFYQHKGIDPTGMFRALLVNIKSGDLTQGGSTISQQLVKNTFLTTDKTFARKIKEIILTLKLEKSLSKDRILELYLNEIPYGGSNYGIEAASKNFFGKTAEDISLAEAAYLASLPKAPTYYSPYGNHLDKLEARKNIVLDRMVSLNFIAQKEADEAKKEEVNFLQKGNNSIKAPHFSILIRSYLEEKYGQDVVEQGGLKVITTLDYPLQEKAEDLVARYTKENKEKFSATNGAMVAIDPKTGQLLVMVGSKDYFDKEEDGNYNVAIAQRQPGSAIKPFIYATAFEKGYTPETVVFDLQTEFNPSCAPEGVPKEGIKMEADKCYMPGNYDDKFRGPISLKSSLAESLNVPSVKTLYLAGIMDSLKTIKNVGITTLNDPNRYGLTLVLGGGEVSLLELTGAYATLANNGLRNPTTMILKIEDKNGNILEEYKSEAKQVLDKNIALTVTDILSDNDLRAPAFGSRSPLYFDGFQVAAKTGTTNNSRDAWIVGYTPNIVVGSWVGNNDNTPMVKETAGFIVAPMWNEFMNDMLKNLPKED
ncbi:MAG: Penicillin-binding protein, 1A family, partial [Parcubacteria group bacterium GW2011_GWB2_40_8]